MQFVLTGSMCPWWNLPDERLLDGDCLLFDDVVDNSVVKDLLFNYMTPQNTRIDLMSSLFGRDGDDNEREGNTTEIDEVKIDGDARHTFDVSKAGAPIIEPRFGTKFWEESIDYNILQQWVDAAAPQLPPDNLLLGLPPQNPFIPTNLDLKPLPGEMIRIIAHNMHFLKSHICLLFCWTISADDAAHPLVNCSVKVCVTTGKKKSWYPAVATQYKIEKKKSSEIPRIMLSYEDDDKKWHVLDSPHDTALTDDNLLEPGYEGSLGELLYKSRYSLLELCMLTSSP